ncbi:MAG: class I mannose-6-phosphate isomerase [Phycisphaerales bacterium]|nr:class I mannose-6-phosphate isomerase [Phycisphaerales bacterium]
MNLPPLRFDPILKPRVWGGDRLRRFGRSSAEAMTIGESWGLADLPESIEQGRSSIADGEFAGLRLHDLIRRDPGAVLGPVAEVTGSFPLLVKLLDARENLSVQVHPDAAYARRHPDAFIKNEAWFVLEADADSAIYRGVDPSLDAEGFREIARTGERMLEHLIRIPVRRGDCVRLPSGICHALGAGVLVAEVQTPSDTTFRVWDWNRDDPERPLHLDQAMECMRFGAAQEDGSTAISRLDEIPPVETSGYRRRRLCLTPDFTIDHIEVASGAHPLTAGSTPTVLLAIDGAGVVRDAEARETRFREGDTVLIPSSCNGPVIRTENSMTLLQIDVPARPGIMLA